MKVAAAAVAAFLLAGCASGPQIASSSPTSASQVASNSPVAASPIARSSPTPLLVGTPVKRQVLAPATVLPLAALCSHTVFVTADGNYSPTFCRGGGINVAAWKKYVTISPNLLSAGRTATFEAIRAATCRDDSAYHATFVEEEYAYEMSAAYYGWNFATEPNCR